MNEIIIDKNAKQITFTNNGIGFSQFGIADEVLDLIESQIKEIERLNNIIKEQGLEDKPNYYVKGLEGSLKEYQEEVKSLNNIINELEKWLDEESEKTILSTGHLTCLMMCKSKLQELKGSVGNEICNQEDNK